jgi:hypothetical protein
MESRRLALLLGLLAGSPVLAHPKGFHKRDVLTVTNAGVEALITLDLDSGPRSQLLRQGVDRSGDGALDRDEVAALKGKLVELAVRPFKLDVSTHALRVEVLESKVNLRGDSRVSESGLSVAVLVRAGFPRAPSPGMTLTVLDEAPDRSHVAVEVHRSIPGDGGASAPERAELTGGASLKVSLGKM